MKIKIIILFLAFLFYAVTLNAQNQIRIDTISVNYFNGITKKKEIIDIYQIKNDSDEDYLTWVSLAPINNRTNTKLIRDYFIKTKGDYNLIKTFPVNGTIKKYRLNASGWYLRKNGRHKQHIALPIFKKSLQIG